MRTWIFLLAASVNILLSSISAVDDLPKPASLVNLTALSSSIVNGSVSAVSGDYLDAGQHTVVSGPDPYYLGHTYCSSSREEGTLGDGWNFSHHHYLQVYQPGPINYTAENPHKHELSKNEKGHCIHGLHSGNSDKNHHTDLYLIEPSGSRLHFKGDGWAHHFELVTKNTGYTNVCGSEISGQSNIKNIKIVWHCESDRWHVYYGDGTRRVYGRMKHSVHKRNIYRECFRDYHIEQEIRPSGNQIRFFYRDDDTLYGVSSYNADMSHKHAWLYFEKKKSGIAVRTSDRQEYHFSFRKGSHRVSSIRRPGLYPLRFLYSEKKADQRRVIRKETKDGYFLETKYSPHGRVRYQKAPAGPGGKAIVTHRFSYHKRDKYNFTIVKDAHGNSTHYFWNKLKRLTKVIKKDAAGHQLMAEGYVWGTGKQHGFLKVRTLFDEENRPILSRQFHYDSRGNVIEEELFGQFTDGIGEVKLDRHGFPHNCSCDKVTTRRTFSNDGFNLKLSEEDPLGNFTYFEYYKKSNLLKAKYICEKKEIKKREFFTYNKSCCLTEHIVDDGSKKEKGDLQGVTERHITVIHPRNKRPHFGEPRMIDEFYLDLKTKKRKLLGRTINRFSDEGLVIKKENYDSKKVLRSISLYEYDKEGRVVAVTDSLKRTTRFGYDKQGRLAKRETEQLISYYEYDLMGHLVKQEDRDRSGVSLVTRYAYDELGRKVATIDPQGNSTRFSYDALDRITKIVYPKIHSEKGTAMAPTKSYRYEKLGTLIWEADENGNETKTYLNVQGKILVQQFPDQTKEQHVFDLLGQPVKEVASNGTELLMTYDAFGRVTSSQMKRGEKLFSKKTTRYNGFHPIAEISPTGEELLYSYDAAGRKRKVTLKGKEEERTTLYAYDSLGRLKAEGTADCMTYYRYDEANRVIRKTVRDAEKKQRFLQLFGYDTDDNVTHETHFPDGKEAVAIYKYDAFKRLCERIDAEGNCWRYCYDDFSINTHKQTVCKKTVIHPTAISEVELFDARGKLSQAVRQDPLGKTISKRELFYDRAGNCVTTKEKKVVTSCSYDSRNRLTVLIEASGTSDERITRYVYNRHGQKKQILFSDGTSINYAYDAKGRLSHYYGKEFDYRYSYDKADRILSAKNLLTGKRTRRTYNSVGELATETLETGLKVAYRYDALGRVSTLTLPDESTVEYRYRALYLESITSKKNEETQWVTKVLKRDLAGNILSTQLPGNAGTLKKRWDRLNRLVAIEHPQFRETIDQFDAAGNLLSLSRDNVTSRYCYNDLYQLTEESGAYANSYRYDALHNRRAHNGKRVVCNVHNSVLHDGVRAFRYDKRGNRVKAGEVRYVYDGLDRLIGVINPLESTFYYYDAFNRRIEKRSKNGRERYIYVGQDEIGTVVKGDITELRVLGEGLGAELGAAVAMEFNHELYVPLHDHRGNVACLLDRDGALVESYSYDAFGVEEAASTKSPWRFSSKRVDPETGLVFFGRRYYDPLLGKWLTRDPIGRAAGPNLYAYVLNNPMTHYDCYGLFDEVGPPERTFGDKVVDFCADVYRRVRDIVCKVGEEIVHNIPHIGTLNDRVEDALRSFRGASEKQRPPEGLYQIDTSFPIGKGMRGRVQHGAGVTSECIAWAHANGLFCSFKDAMKNAKLIAEDMRLTGANMYLLYSESHGVFMDIVRAALNISFVETSSVQPIAEGLRQIVSSCDTGQYAVLNPHSNGGQTTFLATKQLTADERQRIYVESIASTHIFSIREGFFDARNYIGRSDFVSAISHPHGLITNRIAQRGEVNLVGGFMKFPFSNHSFRSGEYSQITKRLVSEHFN